MRLAGGVCGDAGGEYRFVSGLRRRKVMQKDAPVRLQVDVMQALEVRSCPRSVELGRREVLSRSWSAWRLSAVHCSPFERMQQGMSSCKHEEGRRRVQARGVGTRGKGEKQPGQ